ncbi:MAG: hypothetical protein LBU65_01170 [Planctomycetaceae bacterium]|nr:hypothetical protein [Planctomycetaceae bacterium]
MQLCLFVLLAIGCNSSGISGLVRASGKVTLDGSPVGGVAIVFTPVPGSSSDRVASAVSSDDGTFVLDTIGNKGALPGSYVVTLSKSTTKSKITAEEEERLNTAGKPLPEPEIIYHIPWKYERTDSGITVEIDKGGKTDILIELKSDNTPPPVRSNI